MAWQQGGGTVGVSNLCSAVLPVTYIICALIVHTLQSYSERSGHHLEERARPTVPRSAFEGVINKC
jgi:hypothetical protein